MIKKNVYSVAQINSYIKNMFAQDFMMKNVRIRGEVSNCKYHSTGHIYFTMKDEKGSISAIMFAGNRKGLSFPMKDGDTVIAAGSIEVFERDGKYQLYAREIEKDGEGDLYQRFLKLKQELEEMGMFATEYKKPLPRYIRTLGIVTASTGAVIQDIRQVAFRRNPYVQLILFPAQVQGEGAAQSIVRGIEALDTAGVDIIIVGRGGGSIEDLWAFNEEIVARAVFDCNTPVISAVGHETDFTIVDFVADMRAPTPSAAAELAVFEYEAFESMLSEYRRRMERTLESKLLQERRRVMYYQAKLNGHNPLKRMNELRQTAVYLEEKMTVIMEQKLKNTRYRLGLLAGKLDSLSPTKKLSQGLAYLTDQKNRRIFDVEQVQKEDLIQIRIQNGMIEARVTETRKYKDPKAKAGQ